MQLKILLQYIVPQHLLSRIAGSMAECRWPWLKNALIKFFIQRYQIDLSLAVDENIENYPDFNSFFTRHLKPEKRPIVQDSRQLACPVDGVISQIGHIENDAIFQAKGFYFSLKTLLGDDEALTTPFKNGEYTTIYLAPKDYHRVHMPTNGTLRETIYIPGNLFSVNQYTTHQVPNLFARNERLVCLFDTEQGPMAVILVGAMLVGSIQTVWSQEMRHTHIFKKTFTDIKLNRGEELGLFKMGSTVILLFPEKQITWHNDLHEDSKVCFGESIGNYQ